MEKQRRREIEQKDKDPNHTGIVNPKSILNLPSYQFPFSIISNNLKQIYQDPPNNSLIHNHNPQQ
jgi:hypothetical protein